MGKKILDMPIPSNLKYCKNCNAIAGDTIKVRFNKTKGIFLVPHKKAGGRGQGIVLKKAVAWVEEWFER